MERHQFLAHLHTLLKTTWNPHHDSSIFGTELEKLDSLHSEGMIYVEKCCCKFLMGSVAFSLELSKQCNLTLLWSLICHKLS